MNLGMNATRELSSGTLKQINSGASALARQRSSIAKEIW